MTGIELNLPEDPTGAFTTGFYELAIIVVILLGMLMLGYGIYKAARQRARRRMWTFSAERGKSSVKSSVQSSVEPAEAVSDISEVSEVPAVSGDTVPAEDHPEEDVIRGFDPLRAPSVLNALGGILLLMALAVMYPAYVQSQEFEDFRVSHYESKKVSNLEDFQDYYGVDLVVDDAAMTAEEFYTMQAALYSEKSEYAEVSFTDRVTDDPVETGFVVMTSSEKGDAALSMGIYAQDLDLEKDSVVEQNEPSEGYGSYQVVDRKTGEILLR